MSPLRFRISEACEILSVEESFILLCVRSGWILPAGAETPEFDEEDLARLRLILDLRMTFEANDEAIPLILHLLDQVYLLRHRAEKLRNRIEELESPARDSA